VELACLEFLPTPLPGRDRLFVSAPVVLAHVVRFTTG